MELRLADIVIASEQLQHTVLTEELHRNLRDEDCIICLSRMRVGALVSGTSCGHQFHYPCLIPHLIRVGLCLSSTPHVRFAELSSHKVSSRCPTYSSTSPESYAHSQGSRKEFTLESGKLASLKHPPDPIQRKPRPDADGERTAR